MLPSSIWFTLCHLTSQMAYILWLSLVATILRSSIQHLHGLSQMANSQLTVV